MLFRSIDSAGNLNVYGRPRPVEEYVAGEAQASLISARVSNPDMKLGDELNTTVVVRADRATPFHLLNRVIKACQDNGFRKFALRAMNRRA